MIAVIPAFVQCPPALFGALSGSLAPAPEVGFGTRQKSSSPDRESPRQHDQHQPHPHRHQRGDQDRRTHGHHGHAEPAAPDQRQLPGPGHRQSHQRPVFSRRRSHRQPARPRAQPHAGAGRRSPARRRLAADSDLCARPRRGPDPGALVERVEVVTGGASAVYGSDAIAGVINFITRKNFEGLQLDAQYGGNWHDNSNGFCASGWLEDGRDRSPGTVWDGKTVNASLTAGANILDGRGNVTGYFGYQKMDPVRSSDRDFGSCQLTYNDDLDDILCAGIIELELFRPAGPATPRIRCTATSSCRAPRRASAPPAFFNSQGYIYMQRGDRALQRRFHGACGRERPRRALCGVLVHERPDAPGSRAHRPVPPVRTSSPTPATIWSTAATRC